jgi:hypothetical protein
VRLNMFMPFYLLMKCFVCQEAPFKWWWTLSNC